MRLPPVSVIRFHLKELVDADDQQEYGRTVAEYLDQALTELEELKRLYAAVGGELQRTRTALVDMQEAMARQAAASPRVAAVVVDPSDAQVVLDILGVRATDVVRPLPPVEVEDWGDRIDHDDDDAQHGADHVIDADRG